MQLSGKGVRGQDRESGSGSCLTAQAGQAVKTVVLPRAGLPVSRAAEKAAPGLGLDADSALCSSVSDWFCPPSPAHTCCPSPAPQLRPWPSLAAAGCPLRSAGGEAEEGEWAEGEIEL